MIIAYKFRWKNFWIGFSLKTWFNFKKTAEVLGITDACFGSPFRRVLFLEFDHKLSYEQLICELKGVQKEFKLSNLYILRSSKNPDGDSYHVYCCCKLTSKEINNIVDRTSSDEMFKNVALFDYVPKVLRISKKGNKDIPEYIGVLKAKGSREKSFAHLQFLLQFFKIPKEDMDFTNNDEHKLKDKDQILQTISYPTQHNVI